MIHVCQRIYFRGRRAEAEQRLIACDRLVTGRRTCPREASTTAPTGAKPPACNDPFEAAAGGAFAGAIARLKPSPEQLRVLKGLGPYVWPSDRPDLQATVVLSLVLMLVAKLVTVAMPFTFKWATDALVAASGGKLPGRRRRWPG